MKIRRRRGCDDGNLDGNFRFEMRLETQRKKQELSRMTKAVNLRAGSALAHFFPPFAFFRQNNNSSLFQGEWLSPDNELPYRYQKVTRISGPNKSNQRQGR